MSNRAWKVRANSFSRADYEIEGANIRDAVYHGVGRILEDIAPWVSTEDVLSMEMRWRPDILSGMGGAEVNMTVISDGSMTSLVAWIGANRDDTPALTLWQRSGTSLRMISTGRPASRKIVAA